jgi:hypothetical protein
VKQYSTDVAIALLLYLLTVCLASKELTTPRTAVFGIVGAIAIWFSHSSVFVLSGIGVTLIIFYLTRRQWARLGKLALPFALWGISLVAYYLVSLRGLSNDESLLEFWQRAGAFAPFPPTSVSAARWYVDRFFGSFHDPVGLPVSGIAALALFAGCVSLYSKRRDVLFILVAPAFLALLASGLHVYPFTGRFLLFMVPSVMLLVGEGVQYVRDSIRASSAVVGVGFIGLIFLHPILSAGYRLILPRTDSSIKSVLHYVSERKRPGDVLYLYHRSQFAFQYYADRYGLNNADSIVGSGGRRNWQAYANQLNGLQGNERVWVLFSQVYPPEEETFFLYHLDSIGTRLNSFRSRGAAAYLYDLAGQQTNREL